MEKDIEKKLKDVMKVTKKNKIADLKVKVGVYAGKRGPYKIYKVGAGKLVAIRTKKGMKGGIEPEDVDKVLYEEKVFKLGDLDDHKFDDSDEDIKEELVDRALLKPKVVEAVEIKPVKKRVQSAKQKEWMDHVARVSMLPEMKGKSRTFVLQEASKSYKK